MEAGLGALQISPREFWMMTPNELAAALRGRFGGSAGGGSLGEIELAALMARFPD